MPSQFWNNVGKLKSHKSHMSHQSACRSFLLLWALYFYNPRANHVKEAEKHCVELAHWICKVILLGVFHGAFLQFQVCLSAGWILWNNTSWSIAVSFSWAPGKVKWDENKYILYLFLFSISKPLSLILIGFILLFIMASNMPPPNRAKEPCWCSNRKGHRVKAKLLEPHEPRRERTVLLR